MNGKDRSNEYPNVLKRLASDPEYRERFAERHRRSQERRRFRLITRLGGRCRVCGQGDWDVLTFDHVVPRSKTGHKPSSGGASAIMADLNAGRLTDSQVQLLCANCHIRKTRAELRKPPRAVKPKEGAL